MFKFYLTLGFICTILTEFPALNIEHVLLNLKKNYSTITNTIELNNFNKNNKKLKFKIDTNDIFLYNKKIVKKNINDIIIKESGTTLKHKKHE